jgi:hypothetical protein
MPANWKKSIKILQRIVHKLSIFESFVNSKAFGGKRRRFYKFSTILTLSLTAYLMLLISLQSYKLAPPPKKKTRLGKLKMILMMSRGPLCNLPYFLCRYSSIL